MYLAEFRWLGLFTLSIITNDVRNDVARVAIIHFLRHWFYLSNQLHALVLSPC